MKLTFSTIYNLIVKALPAAALLFPSTGYCTGLDPALIDRIESSTSAINNLGVMAFDINPGAAAYRQDYTLGAFKLTADYLHQDKAEIVQNGNGHLTGAFNVESYMRLNKSTRVWGGAEFRTGQFRNIRWNNSADYLRIAPYVIGDSVGGDVQSRQYTFNGGYAGIKGRWTWGAQAAYRADIEYRNRDPRVKIIVSDLNIDLGASYSLTPRYRAGVSAGINVYVQESDLEFYNPINTIQTYAMTGMGTTYTRFSGNSTESTAYSGIGYHTSLQLFSTTPYGLRLSVDYNFIRIDQILRDYNNLTLTYTDNYLLSGQTSYALQLSGIITAGAQLHARWQRRLGTENLFGTSIGNNYERISSRTFYYHDIVTSQFTVPIQISLGRWQIVATPSLSFDYDRESYHRPYRDLECHGYTYGLAAECRWKVSGTLVRFGGKYAYSDRTSDKHILTSLNCNSSIGKTVESNYMMLSSDRRLTAISAGIDHTINRTMALYTDIRYLLTDYVNANNFSNHLTASIGIRF